jgi:2-polyprenyl-3-methyl-5-hydroxy-6-metoxy-1,4-benzoquinol methylase
MKTKEDENVNQMTVPPLIREEINSKIKGCVLDIGCGEGRIVNYLLKIGNTKEVIGLDVNVIHLKWHENRICGDAQFLPFKNATFDSVTCIEVLEHLQNPELCVREINRVLKTGGSVVLSSPTLNIPLPILVSIFRKFIGMELTDSVKSSDRHHHVFSTNNLINMLNSNDFNLENIIPFRFTTIFLRLMKYKTLEKIDLIIVNLCRKLRIPICKFIAQGVLISARKI